MWESVIGRVAGVPTTFNAFYRNKKFRPDCGRNFALRLGGAGMFSPPRNNGLTRRTVVCPVIFDLDLGTANGVGHRFSAGVADLAKADFFDNAGNL